MDQLVALAGWTPTLTPAQASELTAAAAGSASREQFTTALNGETGLGDTWVQGFFAHHTSPSTEIAPEQNGQSS